MHTVIDPFRASQVALMVIHLECRRYKDMQVQFLGQEDTLEKDMATHSSFLPRKIPWTEDHGGLQSTGLQKVGHN